MQAGVNAMSVWYHFRMITWKAKVFCERDGCKRCGKVTLSISQSDGHVRVEKRPKGWTVPWSGTGRHLCPVHSEQRQTKKRRGPVKGWEGWEATSTPETIDKGRYRRGNCDPDAPHISEGSRQMRLRYAEANEAQDKANTLEAQARCTDDGR